MTVKINSNLIMENFFPLSTIKEESELISPMESKSLINSTKMPLQDITHTIQYIY